MRTAAVLVLALAGWHAAPTAAVPAQPAAEQEAPPVAIVHDIASLNDGADATGRIAVNVAAGDNNQQANAGVLAVGGTALGTGSVAQFLAESPARGGTRNAIIGGDAFAGADGMIAVNVVAGSDNQEANLAVIAMGFEGQAVTDATLSQARASQQPTGGPEGAVYPESATGISTGAFQGSSGLVQVNLIGGERNSSANVFALTVTAGANP